MEQAWDGAEASDGYLRACSFTSSLMYLDEFLVKLEPMSGRGSGSIQQGNGHILGCFLKTLLMSLSGVTSLMFY